jgi:hypothetical protein
VDSESTGPKRRLGSPLTVLAVAAVLAAGGGGAYWASTHASGDGITRPSGAPGRDSPPEPLHLTGVPAAAGGRLTLADGVQPAQGRKSAPVQRPETVSQAAVAKLAKALAVPGSVKSDGGLWKVGNTRDAGGPLLQVNRQVPGTWSYSRFGSRARPGQGEAVSAKEALRTAAPVLAATGPDGATSRTDAAKTTGGLRAVTADPVVDGLPTHDWRTTLQIGPDGTVVSGSGRLSPLKASAPYPVVSAGQALKTLNKGGDGAVGAVRCPTAQRSQSKSPGEQTLPRSMPCIPSRAQSMTVRSAQFGLSAQYVDGYPALVPSWLFAVARSGERDTYVVPAQAVDPAYVRTPFDEAPPSPSDGRPAGARTVGIQSYTASGSTVKVRFWGGVCNTYSASADESGDKVTVRVTGVPRQPGRVCAMIAKEFTKTVRLSEPLGDRQVIDARDGTSIKPVAKSGE